MIIKSFGDVHRTLAGYVANVISLQHAYTLDRMRLLMAQLGTPQDAYKVIHVAGTSGKTSTSYYIASLLAQGRYRVGLTVSPHIDEVNERVQINMVPLDEQRYCKLFSEFLELVEHVDLRPTYFELLTAFAFWVFVREKVDYAVVEVGLGGTLDSTNVMTRPDKLAVLTDMGIDHIQVLGKTLADITAQKAGIILPGNNVLMYEQGQEVMEVVRRVCAERPAQLTIVPELSGQHGCDLPLFQQRNWGLALAAYRQVARRDGLLVLDQDQLSRAMQQYIPARMEIMEVNNKTVVMDGAHNAQKLAALMASVRAAFPGKRIVAVCALAHNGSGRERGALHTILAAADRVILTNFTVSDDMRRSLVDPEALRQYTEPKDRGRVTVVRDLTAAYMRAQNSPEEVVVITGSFFLVSAIRPIVQATLARL
jgi:dihydrofolate synthase / folylpolyglutamate synthase